MPEMRPGGKGIACKKHRPGELFSQTLCLTSAKGSGPWGDPPDRPYKELTQAQGSGTLPALSMESKAPHDFCMQCPCPRPGPGGSRTLWNLKKNLDRGGELYYFVYKL